MVGGNPRFHMHFTPTGGSWMNPVERFLADLTRDVVRAGGFCSVKQLIREIEFYPAGRNKSPKPYRWHAVGEEIPAKIKRARARIGAEASIKI